MGSEPHVPSHGIIKRFGRWWARTKQYVEENTYLDAGAEFVFVFIVSNSPFLFAFLTTLLSSQEVEPNSAGALTVLKELVKPGEILFYVAALLAPFCYVLVRFHRARRVFPLFGFAIIVLILVYGSCTVLLVVYRVHSLKNPALVEVFAFYLYCISVFLWYVALVFQRKLEKLTTLPRSGAEEILRGLNG